MKDELLDSLTPREKDCLRLVLKTDAHKQIAFQLGLATETVNGYLKSAIRKLGVSSSRRAAQILADYEANGTLPQSWGDHSTTLSPTEKSALTMASADLDRSAISGLLQRWLRMPARRVEGGGNDLNAVQRLRESFQAMFIAIASIGVIVAALTGIGILAHTWFAKP